jgi:diguanylate cyclase (GGDEF)-like protein
LSFFDEKNLTKWVVIIPIISVIVTVLVFVISGINNKRNTLQVEIEQKQIKLLKEHKKEAMQKVNGIASFLKTTKELQKEQAREDVKNMVNIALTMINDIYYNNQHLTKKEILKKVKDALRYVRFWDLTGYFFIYDLDGLCVLLPPLESMENKNFIDLKDAKGKYTIKEHIRIVKEKNEGFIEWYWYKPNEEKMKKKIGFVKIFKPLNIYIGTARYDEDIVQNIKNKMLKLVQSDKKGFFIYDGNGKSIINEGQSIGKSEIDTIVKGGKIIPDGFFINHTLSMYYNIFKEVKDGTFFVRYMPEYDWIVGLDTYNEDVIKALEEERSRLEFGYTKLIKNRILFAFIILLFVLLATIFFSNKLKKVLKRYQKNLVEQHKITLKQQEKLTHNLKHDHLTTLPNRILLTDRLEQDIKHSKRNNKQVAVLFMDLDKFKSINDSLGHDMGDILLQEIGQRLKKSIRKSDTVARFGGDEFVVLVDDVKNIHDVIRVIDKIQKALKKKIILGETEHNITLSIGISVFPNDGQDAQTILRNADIAMYKAKQTGGNNYRFFTAKMNEETQHQISLEKELRQAVSNEEFVLYYQPIVESKSGNILGVEALIRWNHPTKGLIFPDEFIGIAEQSSVIIEMGQWVVIESMRQIKKWKDKGFELNKISINIAVKQLENKGFVHRMKKMLNHTSCKAEWIELEIIERFAMRDIEKSISILNELREMNIGIAIDDFGTGHSSMAYLKELPITKLKIDRAFVKDILKSDEDKAIAESILALGSGLGLEVLAEGIETQEQREFFTNHNCHQMQGYFFSKPLPLEKVEKLLIKGSCG